MQHLVDWCQAPSAAEQAAAADYLREARARTEHGAEWPAGAPHAHDGTVGVVGAGTMGTGIALCALAAGLQVRLADARPEGLQQGMARIRATLDSALARGRIDADERARRWQRLQPVDGLAALAGAGVVIEAIYENMAAKQALLASLHPAHPGRGQGLPCQRHRSGVGAGLRLPRQPRRAALHGRTARALGGPGVACGSPQAPAGPSRTA